MLKEDYHRVLLSVNHFLQVFLEDFELIQKVKKVIRYITDDFEVSLDDSGRSHKK